MTRQTLDTVTVAKITLTGTITVAIISLIGNLILGYWQFIRKPSETNQPTPTPASNALAIEQLPMTLFVYDGRGENLGGWSDLKLSFLNSMPNYKFDYSIPSDQTGYAGMAFRFSEGQNVSKYQRIEFTIQFDGKESQHVMDFYLTDISGQKSPVRITEIGSNEKKESELLSNFVNTNLNAIKEMVFNVDNTFVTGDHQVTVSNIHFVP